MGTVAADIDEVELLRRGRAFGLQLHIIAADPAHDLVAIQMQLVRIAKPGGLQMGDRRLHALGHHKLDIMDFDIRFSGIATDIKQI